MAAARKDSLALVSLVLSPTKRANAASLDQQWEDVARFMRSAGSALARWVAIGQMHSVYRQMKLRRSADLHGSQNPPVGDFVERACDATGVGRQTVYNYVDRSRQLVEVLGPQVLRVMLSGKERVANDENLLIKVAQLPPDKALRVVTTYMRGGKGEAQAAHLAESASTRSLAARIVSIQASLKALTGAALEIDLGATLASCAIAAPICSLRS